MLFASETLTKALHQLELYGRDGLPVISDDGRHLQGWLTSHNVLQAVTRHIDAKALSAGEPDLPGSPGSPGQVPTPLDSYQLLEVTIPAGSAAVGQKLGDITWPPGYVPVTVLDARTLRAPDSAITLAPGDHVSLLAPAPPNPERSRPRGEPGSQPGDHPADARRAGQAPGAEDSD